MTSYHVSVLYDTSLGTGCSKNGAQFKNEDFRVRKVCINKTVAILARLQYLIR